MTDLYSFNTKIEKLTSIADADFYVKRDDRIAFTFGTKVRKFTGLLPFLLENKNQPVVISGNYHSNFLAVFSYLLSLENISFITIAQSRNPQRVTANSILTEFSSLKIHFVKTREEREKLLEEFKRNSEYVVLEDYCMNRLCMQGLHSLWHEIENEDFDTLLLDIGSGLTFLSLYDYYAQGKLPYAVAGVAIGSEKEKLENEMLSLAEKFGLKLHNYKFFSPTIDPGYGKHSVKLDVWVKEKFQEWKIPLEPLYSAKTIFTAMELAKTGILQGRILYIHQGGYLNFMDLFT